MLISRFLQKNSTKFSKIGFPVYTAFFEKTIKNNTKINFQVFMTGKFDKKCQISEKKFTNMKKSNLRSIIIGVALRPTFLWEFITLTKTCHLEETSFILNFCYSFKNCCQDGSISSLLQNFRNEIKNNDLTVFGLRAD